MIIEIILLVLAIPVGYFLAWLACDELVHGRKWFKALMILCIIGIAIFILFWNSTITWSFAFIFIVSGISFIKSFDRRWIRKGLKKQRE